MVKNIALVLNAIALVLSIMWAIKSKFEYEPIILSITLVAVLVGIIYAKNGRRNKTVIKGDQNKVTQNGSAEEVNESEITGNSNEVNQGS